MKKTKILVVEDEAIVAKDIQNTLIKLGYDVPATASSSVTAFQKVEELKPDLVFLDIKLKGDIDGIEIAEQIKKAYKIPVIFLTSFVDKTTLDRAKVTEPYGYIVKPFNETDLQTTVEMALYKFSRDTEIRDNHQRFANALTTLNEAIIITDTDCKITFLNPKAETITGFNNEVASGIELFKIMKIENESSQPVNQEEMVRMMNIPQISNLRNSTVTISRDNSVLSTDIISSPIRDENDLLIGNALLIRNRSEHGALPTGPNAELPLVNQVIQNYFFVKKGSMLVKVFLDNIQWIQAMDNYVIIQTNQDQFVIHSTMKDVEAKLPSEKFMRVHRSYIIPLEKINVLDENTVVITDKTIPIGKSYRDAFLSRLSFL